MIQTVVSDVLFFVVGVLVGYTSTRFATDPEGLSVTMKEARHRITKPPVFSVVGMLALIVAGVQVVVSQQQSEHTTTCLTQYANELYDSLTPRQASAEKLQAADLRFKRAVTALLEPGNDQGDMEAVRKAAAHNIKIADRLTQSRKANPYPEPPRKVCD